MVFAIYVVSLTQAVNVAPNKINVLSVPLKGILSIAIINANSVVVPFKAVSNVKINSSALNVKFPTF